MTLSSSFIQWVMKVFIKLFNECIQIFIGRRCEKILWHRFENVKYVWSTRSSSFPPPDCFSQCQFLTVCGTIFPWTSQTACRRLTEKQPSWWFLTGSLSILILFLLLIHTLLSLLCKLSLIIYSNSMGWCKW